MRRKDKSSFDHLDEDSIYEIFRFLPPKETVRFERLSSRIFVICRSLQRITKSLVISVNGGSREYNYCGDRAHDPPPSIEIKNFKFFLKICSKFKNIKTLYLSINDSICEWLAVDFEETAKFYADLEYKFQKLEHVQSNFYVAKFFGSLLKWNQNVKHLIIIVEVEIDLFKFCPNLEVIYIGDLNNLYLPFNGFGAVKMCPKLKTVLTSSIETEALENLSYNPIHSLKELKIFYVQSENISPIFELNKLTRIELDFLNPTKLHVPITQIFRHLLYLRVFNNRNVLSIFVERSPNLTHLVTDCVSDKLIATLPICCPKLKYLTISNAIYRYRTFNNPSLIVKMLPKFKYLETLILDYYDFTILVDFLKELKKNCYSLKFVILKVNCFYGSLGFNEFNYYIHSVALNNEKVKFIISGVSFRAESHFRNLEIINTS